MPLKRLYSLLRNELTQQKFQQQQPILVRHDRSSSCSLPSSLRSSFLSSTSLQQRPLLHVGTARGGETSSLTMMEGVRTTAATARSAFMSSFFSSLVTTRKAPSFPTRTVVICPQVLLLHSHCSTTGSRGHSSSSINQPQWNRDNINPVGNSTGSTTYKYSTENHTIESYGDFNTSNKEDHYSLVQLTNEQLMDTSTIPGWDLVHTPPRKLLRGSLVGIVVSDKMQKTINVAVQRYYMVPKLRIRRKYTRKFMAHDENEIASMGDLVLIIPCQRISKNKHFMLFEIIKQKGIL